MIINRLGQHRSHDHITHKRKKEKESNEACQILNLPDECLFIILSHVPMHQLIEISAVCKRLRTITMDDLLWNAHFTQLLNSISPAPGTIKRRKKSIEQKENKVKITRNLEYLSKLHRNLWNTNELPIELFNPESFGKSDDHPLVTDIWTTNDTGNSENEDIIWGERKPCCRKVVVAGKLNKLIEILTCVEEIDLQFVKAFLMTFESFTFAEVFFIKLMQRYHVPLSTQALFPSVEHWKKELFFPVRFRVVNILKLLIEKVRYSFYYYLFPSSTSTAPLPLPPSFQFLSFPYFSFPVLAYPPSSFLYCFSVLPLLPPSCFFSFSLGCSLLFHMGFLSNFECFCFVVFILISRNYFRMGGKMNSMWKEYVLMSG